MQMEKNDRRIFSNMRILQGQTWIEHHALIVEDGKIKSIIPNNMISHHFPAQEIKLRADDMLVPGFIDLHIHGARGSDVMDATTEAFTTISAALAEEGVTGYLATTMTAPKKEIEAVLAAIPAAMKDKAGAAILGVHLEGPFIAKDKRGAQLADELLEPNVEQFKAWQAIAQGAIKLVTLAPELPNVTALITALHDAEIIAAIGHTNASYEQTMQAIKAGCSHATHLFNAMRGLHQREPGALGALLLSPTVSADLIVDGVHLHPAIVDIAYRLKGNDGLILISDAMRAKCMGNGQYDLGGQQVTVANARATLSDGTLAGSLLKLPQAIRNMVQYTNCTLLDAIRMVTYNPARKLKLDKQKGSIEIGKDADLVVLSPDLEVNMTMREGLMIFVNNIKNEVTS
jgi:N-acetylglucosamine-6-phosphate deacetylase